MAIKSMCTNIIRKKIDYIVYADDFIAGFGIRKKQKDIIKN